MNWSFIRRLSGLVGVAAQLAAAKPLTVISFGDSTTAPRKQVETYTRQLERRFVASAPSLRFVNRGVPDDNTDRARLRFKADVLDLHPDLVIVQFGLNDSAIDVWKTPPARQPRVAAARYEESLAYFVSELRRAGSQVILMTPNQLRWSPILREKYGRPPYDLSDERGMTRPVAPYAQIVRQVASRFQVPLIDVYSAYDAWEISHRTSCSSLLLDGIHPNTQGHRLVADALEPMIVQLLRLPGARSGQNPTSGIQRPNQ